MSNETERTASVAGLRALADWLESNPAVPALSDQRLLLALSTNAAVEEFATAQGLDVAFDDEGNASCNLKFGPIQYFAYGYADFAEHCERSAERRARQWAARKGLEIRPAEGGAA